MNNLMFLLCAMFLLAGCTKHAVSVNIPPAPAITAERQSAEPATAPSPNAHRYNRGAAIDTVISLKNPSFNPDNQGRISAWHQTEHAAGNSYTFVADPETAYSKPSSARIRRHGSEPFGALQQAINVHPLWHNKTVRLAGWLKSDDVSGAGGTLFLRADGGSGQILDWISMKDASVKGTLDWKRYTVELKIPPATFLLLVSVTLEGGGTLWADDLSIELID